MGFGLDILGWMRGPGKEDSSKKRALHALEEEMYALCGRLHSSRVAKEITREELRALSKHVDSFGQLAMREIHHLPDKASQDMIKDALSSFREVLSSIGSDGKAKSEEGSDCPHHKAHIDMLTRVRDARKMIKDCLH